jgi:hypothetical protein
MVDPSIQFKKKFQKHIAVDIHYYVSSFPETAKKVLIVSGLHGNEGGVIEPLFDFLHHWENTSPSIVFIPDMCPSALKKRKRNNVFRRNENRIFGLGIHDPENSIVKKIITDHAPYDLVVSFHEDPELPEAYLYDVGKDDPAIRLKEWQQGVKEAGINLLNGVDDPNDRALLNVFVDGYNLAPVALQNGQFEHWVVKEHLAKRSLTIEIPSSAAKEQKKKLIEVSFQQLIFCEEAESK